MYHDYHDNHNPVRHISFAIVYTTIRFYRLRFILLHAIPCWYNKHSLFIMKASRPLPSETVGSSVSSRRASRDRLFSDVSLQATLERTWDKTFSLKRTLACIQDSGKELATCYTTFRGAFEITNARLIKNWKEKRKQENLIYEIVKLTLAIFSHLFP